MQSRLFDFKKTNQLQKSNGLHLKLSGASYDALMSGMLLGYSCHPNTLVNYSKELANKNKSQVVFAMQHALSVSNVF